MFNNLLKNELVLVMFGAILTLITTGIIEFFRGKNEKDKKKKNLELVIKLELGTLNKTLDKINTALSYVNYYDFTLIERAEKSLENLQKSREEAIYLSDIYLQEKFIDLISDLSTFVVGIKTIQSIYYDELKKVEKKPINRGVTPTKKISQNTDIKTKEEVLAQFNQRKTEKTMEYIDIKRRLEEMTNRF